MSTRPTHKGPWMHRFLVRLLTVAMAILVYWVLDFVVGDIGNWPGPEWQRADRQKIEKKLIDEYLIKQSKALAEQIGETNRDIATARGRERILNESTTGSQRIMDQLIQLQRANLDKGVKPTKEEQDAQAKAVSQFLTNGKDHQKINEELASLTARLDSQQEEKRLQDKVLAEKQKLVDKALTEEQKSLDRENQSRFQAHQLKVAAVKLSVLVPLLLAAAFLFLKYRRSLYVPLVHAYGLAIMLMVSLVMHDYFPSRYLKYILIGVMLAIVVRALVLMLKKVAFPESDWLIGQYRDAYQSFFCPVCDYPIRRGPLKYMFWSRRSLKKRSFPPNAASNVDEPYTCPMCSTSLFEECSDCHSTRHTLLPSCHHCGDEKPVEQILAVTEPAAVGADATTGEP